MQQKRKNKEFWITKCPRLRSYHWTCSTGSRRCILLRVLQLTKHPTKGTVTLHKALVLQEKTMDPTQSSIKFFHPCAKDTGRHTSSQKQAGGTRIHNNEIRLVCVFLEPQCGDSVTSMMIGKKSRKKQHLCVGPDLTFLNTHSRKPHSILWVRFVFQKQGAMISSMKKPNFNEIPTIPVPLSMRGFLCG